MGHDNPQRGSAATVVGIVAVIVVLLLGGIIVLGVGAVFLVRISAKQTELATRMEADRAVVELEQPKELAARVHVRESTKPELRQASTRELTIEVDQDGAITVDDESMNLDGLRTRLQKDGGNGSVKLAVQLKADPRCLAQHVVAVHSICSEPGVNIVHISILNEPSSATTEPAESQ